MTKVLFFDFWGTLAENGVRSPVKQVKWILRLRDMNFSDYIVTFEDAFMTKKFQSLKEGFDHVLSAFDLKVPTFVVEKLIGMWNKNAILASIYDDVVPALEELKKDYKLVLIANTDPFSISSVVEKHGLQQYFDEIVYSCDTGKLKSDPSSFTDVLEKLDIDKEDAVMIGDSLESDVKSAEAAGIKAVLIDRRDRMEHDPKIGSLDQLKDIL